MDTGVNKNVLEIVLTTQFAIPLMEHAVKVVKLDTLEKVVILVRNFVSFPLLLYSFYISTVLYRFDIIYKLIFSSL